LPRSASPDRGRLSVLAIAYSLAPVGPDAVGGAEQILSALDRALVAAGHQSIVVASEGSQTAGALVATGPIPAAITDAARTEAQRRRHCAIRRALAEFRIDLVHSHALDFAADLPEIEAPMLVTLHLPRAFYPEDAVPGPRPRTWFNCVSKSQRRTFPDCAALLAPIENGVPLDRLPARHARRGFALCLGRICPEKGFEHALDAARIAGVPLLLGGEVFPYKAHRRYFARELLPRLGADARFLGPVGWARKRRLLNAARCLLVPSLAAETSSLVAMEAIACGTPVVAFPAGALADIVEPGITGYLVGSAREMAEVIADIGRIDREQCRAVARRRFSQERMVAEYFALYRRLLGNGTEA
jgi:glycosyltransferase involved in cell wall biosynthesis